MHAGLATEWSSAWVPLSVWNFLFCCVVQSAQNSLTPANVLSNLQIFQVQIWVSHVFPVFRVTLGQKLIVEESYI